jgi:hypothetical protein
METYKIVRFYFKSNRQRIIATGLTLEEAKAHCNDPSTSVEGKYFDGFTKEEQS